MYRYVFIVDTDAIKSDNVFTIIDKTFRDAFNRIVKDSLLSDPSYLNISLIYTDDKQSEKFINESNIEL